MASNVYQDLLNNVRDVRSAAQYAIEHPEWIPEFRKLFPKFDEVYNLMVGMNDYQSGNIGANDLLGIVGLNSSNNFGLNAETENWLNNEIARENTYQQQNYELSSRDTSLLSAGNQLEQLGLSSYGVLQTGGASAGVQSSAAAVSRHSAAEQRQEARINHYNQQMGLAKSLIGAASSMASSGIYGSALGAVKHAGSQIAGAASHSALEALKGSLSEPKLPRVTNSVDSRLKNDPYYSLFY